MLDSPSFWLVFSAVVLGGVASKLVSLAIDGLLWLRSWAVALAAEAGKHRKKGCKG